jgi:hypothetical protein
MGSPIGILDNGHHHIVVLRDQYVARCDVYFSLIHFRARLIETLFDIVQIEDDVISRRFADDANDLTFLDCERFPRIALDDRLADDFHLILLGRIGLQLGTLLIGQPKNKADAQITVRLARA